MLFLSALLSMSRVAEAACVLNGARPTEPLPTMVAGQEFSFVATRDCATLRFMIRGTTVSKTPRLVGPVGPALRAYRVVLTESEWDAVVAASGSTLTWVVTGRTSAGVMTRLVTTNDLNVDEPITIDLSMADAEFSGGGYNSRAGQSVSGAGDVDGDGRADLLIGETGANNDGSGGGARGAAWLILGAVTGTHDLSVAADANLVGAYDGVGSSVSGAGDVDGDGHDDVLIGAPWNNEGGLEAGAAYLVSGPVTGTFDLSLADAKLVGEAMRDWAGRSVSGAGDVDGDGHDDLLVGAIYAGTAGPGAAYLVLGAVTGTLDLSLADARLEGEATGDQAGGSVSDAGDVDADGHDDLLVGAIYDNEGAARAGAAYLMLGPVTGTIDLAVSNAKLVGEEMADLAGTSVSGAGDVDGDGHDDVLVGATGNDEGDGGAGAAYLVLGPVTGTLDLSLADAKLRGEDALDQAGISVSDAGDVDGDGHDDLLVGTLNNGPRGAVYLALGPVTGKVDLSLADLKLVGDEGLDEADVVAGAGDVDGDGHDDLLIGAQGNSSWAGAAYLIYGGGL